MGIAYNSQKYSINNSSNEQTTPHVTEGGCYLTAPLIVDSVVPVWITNVFYNTQVKDAADLVNQKFFISSTVDKDPSLISGNFNALSEEDQQKTLDSFLKKGYSLVVPLKCWVFAKNNTFPPRENS
jgi:hypothetical protein